MSASAISGGEHFGIKLPTRVMAGLAAFAKASAAERASGPGGALAETGPGHPRLCGNEGRACMPGTSPGMTEWLGFKGGPHTPSLPLVEIHIQAVVELVLRQFGRRPRNGVGAADHRNRRLVERDIA